MEYLHRVRKTDLARNTRQVMKVVQRGQTVIVEEHGQPEAAIMDILDYQLQRAAISYYTQREALTARLKPYSEKGLPNSTLSGLKTEQARYDLVVACYLEGYLSLGRVAELLELPWVEVRSRFNHLGFPGLSGPETMEELRQDVQNAEAFSIWNQTNRK